MLKSIECKWQLLITCDKMAQPPQREATCGQNARYMEFKKHYTPEQALQKARQFCGYQERSHQEVKDKLYSLGLHRQQVEEALSRLIEEDYLNEERFACQFAGGKFRMKGWGRVKIKYELKQRQVSEYCIKKALGEISGEDYEDCLQKLAAAKWKTLSPEKNIFIRMRKATDYLLQKGYEPDLIRGALARLRS
jgi:regulatory protein